MSIFFKYFPTFSGSVFVVPRFLRATFRVVDCTLGVRVCGTTSGQLAAFALSFARVRSVFSLLIRIQRIVVKFLFLLNTLMAS